MQGCPKSEGDANKVLNKNIHTFDRNIIAVK
jgi:hypothetical protein